MNEKAALDTFIEAEIAQAIAPYLAMGLSDERIADMKRVLRLALETHPRARALIQSVRPRFVQESGTAPIQEGLDVPEGEARRTR